VVGALAEGAIIKTWAMRGTLHLLTPQGGAAFLSLIAAGRSWEEAGWQRSFGVTTKQMDALRHASREELDGAVLTREELVAAVIKRPGLGHLGDALRASWGMLLKPLAWQGDICFGPSRAGRATFMLPEAASSSWAGIPDPDEAAPTAIAAYVGAYGPTSFDAFIRWLGFGRRRLRTQFDALGDRLAEVEVEGERAHVLAEDLDDLLSSKPTRALRLLPGFDQYVLGPGTRDGHVVPIARRGAVSKHSGWIAPVVVAGGSVCGTWEVDGDNIRIAWFQEAGRVPRKAVAAEVARLGSILSRDLTATVDQAYVPDAHRPSVETNASVGSPPQPIGGIR
jgi:hypothetical protein